MTFIDLAKKELNFQKHLLRQFNKLQRIKDSGELSCLIRKTGQKKYYIKDKNCSRRKYIRKNNPNEMARVYRLLAKGLGEFAAARISKNIKLLVNLIKEFEAYDIRRILNDLPTELKPETIEEGLWAHISRLHAVSQSEKPSRREELKHTTSFGLLTRSKNEALIAELLYAAGIEFYYEKRLEIYDENGNIKVIYPDFTIILADGSIIYWEHKGMMADPVYEEMDRKRMRLYFLNGIYQPLNLIVTVDGPDGEFCGTEIGMIVDSLLVPMAKSRF